MKSIISCLVAAVLLLTGCAGPVSPNPNEVEFYFVADTPSGLRLFSETQAIDPSEGQDNLEFALAGLISGEVQPTDPDYVSLWGPGNSLNSVRVSEEIAIVDIDLGTLNVGSEGELRAIEQIVWTIAGINPLIESVSFLVDGQRVESFAGHVDTTRLFEKGTGLEALNPVQISIPGEGAELSNPVNVFGQACVFEANVSWKLSKEGEVIEEGSVLADQACPERSDWRLVFENLEPGDYFLEAYEVSAEDGSIRSLDSKAFSVR